MDTTWLDIRYALRGFRHAPTFCLTVIATIAIGLGFITALFTVMNAYYFRPVPVRDPQSLYEFFWTDRSGNGYDFTVPEYREFLRENPAFSEAFAYHRVEARSDGRHLSGMLVSGDYFTMLGIGVALGRPLVAADDATPGSQPVVVLNFSTWQNQFASDPAIVGKKVVLRGFPFEVVGVAPYGFAGLGARPADFWAPLTMDARFDGGPDLFGPTQPRLLAIVGRVRPEFTVHQAETGVALWTARLTADHPMAERSTGVAFTSRATPRPFNPKNALAFSLVVVAFAMVLLIGCSNVANLMLARGVGRQREIGIRISLGATRARVVRLLLTESVLLALPASIAGLAVSQAVIGLGLRVLTTTLPPGISGFMSRIPRLSPDLRVFMFGFGASVLAALMFGLVPALQATRTNVMQATRSGLLRNALIVGQITVCALLLITAAILLHGVKQVQTLDAGLSTRDSVEMVITEPTRTRVLARLTSEPLIETLAAAISAPVDRKTNISVTQAAHGTVQQIASNKVSPEYFNVFEIPILRGRDFTADEARSAAPVAVISESAARELWPGQQAVGQSLRLVAENRVVTVIGVAHDEISRWIANGEDNGLLYLPASAQTADCKLFAHVHGDAETARRILDADLTAVDPNAIDEIQRLQIQQWVAEDAYSFQVLYWVAAAIGFSSLLLTLSGIYGVLSYVVSQRTKEIGIRMALGASSGAVTGLVLKESMRLAIAGAVLGSVMALGMSRILASVLVMINTFDALAYGGTTLLILAACAASAYVPSRRASRIDPMITLRYD